MTREETLQVLAILKAAYPSSYNGMTKREAEGTVAIWGMQFAEIPVDIVLMAVHKLISTSKFPPAISEVKAKIETIHYEAHEMLYTSVSDVLPAEAKARYQRIYDATKKFKLAKSAEPTIHEMLAGGHIPQLGTGGE